MEHERRSYNEIKELLGEDTVQILNRKNLVGWDMKEIKWHNKDALN